MQTRIPPLKHFVIFALGLVLAGVTSDSAFAQNRTGTVRSGTNAAQQQKPNILVIMTDDLGI